ncbi:YodL domain-containing protein [uncultured Tyzzerella sp.]|uniref:YodL domain-containing protein n=1 Tax=uncultured Tyzzerella sp. TaxID=2321398 RepID=UPI002942E774|nr:YodL domain-containing protein [uncultured Tyzzerella sp.]
MKIYIEKDILYYYGNKIGYLYEETLYIDENFKTDLLEEYIKNVDFNYIFEKEIFDKISKGDFLKGVIPKQLKKCRVWRLKNEVDEFLKFIPYKEVIEKYRKVVIENYEIVYDEEVETNDLQEIFEKFNNEEKYLYISDLIELYNNNESEVYYIDKFHFFNI